MNGGLRTWLHAGRAVGGLTGSTKRRLDHLTSAVVGVRPQMRVRTQRLGWVRVTESLRDDGDRLSPVDQHARVGVAQHVPGRVAGHLRSNDRLTPRAVQPRTRDRLTTLAGKDKTVLASGVRREMRGQCFDDEVGCRQSRRYRRPVAGYGFCRIYVRSSDQQRVSEAVGQPPPSVVAEVRANDNRPHEDVDDFVRWPLCVEVEQADEGTDTGIVGYVRQIIASLGEAGIEAVPSAPFEDML